ncbi:MAG: dihydrodipicolinate synthase family protein [Acidobacteria bacterium]|nr:dihydrodipicolinate synthase family protein [Acidobacteriota bacterium]
MPVFEGILPAIVTPLDANERFNRTAFERLAARVYAAGVDGLYVCGQTGEGWVQSIEQRKAVAEAAVHASPAGKTVIIHIGAASTAQSIELARHAARVGAHAVSSLPPPGAYSFEEIRAYYRDVAAASETPFLIYYFPSLAPALNTTARMLELCSLPNVAGLKFTDSNLFRLWELRRSGAVVFNGSDEMLAAGLLMGANGGIGSIYNLLPAEFAGLYSNASAGRWEQARQLQSAINEVIRVILQFPVFPAVKATLGFTGLDCGPCIAPRRGLTEEELAELRRGLLATAAGARLLAS